MHETPHHWDYGWARNSHKNKSDNNTSATVAISPVVLGWMCDSPWMRCVWRTIYVEQTSNNRMIPMEWSWWVTSINACEPGEQLIVLANGDDKSDLVGWTLLLLAAKMQSFAHMLLGLSDCNTTLTVLLGLIFSWIKIRDWPIWLFLDWYIGLSWTDSW